MLFIISKLLVFLIKPITWVFVLLLFAIFTKDSKRKKRSLILTFIIIFFFSNQFVFHQVVRFWETKTITMEEIKTPYDIGILLGGYSSFKTLPNHDRLNLNSRGNRFMNAFELYRKGKVKKLLLTGGSGNLAGEKQREAVYVKDFLLELGVPEADIIIEPKSRNTYENALFTKKILDKDYPNARCLLITSAWHLPRAAALFRKTGLQFTAFGVDHMNEKIAMTPAYFLLPNAGSFYRWELLIKEWVGYFVYWLKGDL